MNRTIAHQAVQRAVVGGQLPAVTTRRCAHCGVVAEVYHHHNGYAPEHWLDVQPFCRSCHGKVHMMAVIRTQVMAQGRPLVQLRQLRQEAGYSIRDLAERAFVSPSTVARIEAGNVAQFRTIRRLAEALALKPGDLR